ncbi:hypothetical protein AB0K43_03605 [Kitasatospora sp. NPDC049258]|uniref:hypothetical protein n=1 Tax=Kitasatospora sp. NPDC049258 TaxID=3155394 RepID=UPI003442D00E
MTTTATADTVQADEALRRVRENAARLAERVERHAADLDACHRAERAATPMPARIGGAR